MLKRLNIYFKEMFPLLPRLLLGFIVFGEVHFLILLNYKVFKIHIGIQELIAAYTIFAFYMWLRIADDFKDYELDRRLFAHRPLPSGRVEKRDLIIISVFVQSLAVILNLLYMNNFLFFILLYGYGFLMSKWFFHKSKIQPNLFLALITHNPVQMMVNLYTVSFTCIKYGLQPFTWITFLTLWTLYFPSLIWEISRKIRAPEEETEYVTYSKLFGYKKVTRFVMIITIVDIMTNIALIWNINRWFVAVFIILVSWMTMEFLNYMKTPTRFRIITKVETYTYIQEFLMLLVIAIHIATGRASL